MSCFKVMHHLGVLKLCDIPPPPNVYTPTRMNKMLGEMGRIYRGTGIGGEEGGGYIIGSY